MLGIGCSGLPIRGGMVRQPRGQLSPQGWRDKAQMVSLTLGPGSPAQQESQETKLEMLPRV